MIKNLLAALKIPYRDDKLFSFAFLITLVTPLLFFVGFPDAYEAPRLTFLLIVLACLIFYLAYGKEIVYRLSKTQTILLLSLLGIATLATIFSSDVLSSIVGNFDRHNDSLIFIFCWALLIFLYSSFDEQKKITLAKTWVFVGLLVSALGIFHSFGVGYYSGTGPSFRPITPGFEGNQNFSAMLICGILPFVLPLVVAEKKLITRVIYFAATFLMIWSLPVFASRGAILGIGAAFVVGIVLLILKRFSWKVWVTAGAAAAIFGLLGFFFYNTTRLPSFDNSLNVSADPAALSRIQIWADSVSLIAKHPWLGLGQANYIIGFQGLGNVSLAGLTQYDDAHNLLLHLSVSLGLPATLLFIALIIASLIVNLRSFWKDKSLMSWATLVALIALVISMCFNPVNMANWLLLAFLIGISNYQTLTRLKPITKVWPKILLISLGAIMIAFALLFISSEYFSWEMQNAYHGNDNERVLRLSKYAILSPMYDTLPKSIEAASLIKLQKDPNLIRAKIEKLTQTHKNNSSTYLRAGTLYLMLYQRTQYAPDLKMSLDLVEKANQMQPRYTPILNRAVYIYYLSGNKDAAEQKALQSLTLVDQDKNFTAHLLLSEIYLEENRLPAMYRILKDANEINPSPLLKELLKEYEQGNFKRDKLPIYFPPVDVF